MNTGMDMGMSTGWSIFISVLVIGNLIGVLWLLFATSSKKSVNASGEVESTGHEWDGITELNHPLPKWWFNLFVLTAIFAAVYAYLYPALGNFEGSKKWTQLNQLDEQMAAKNAAQAEYFKRFEGKDVAQLQADGEAMKTGSRLFANNCAQCHGSDAHGSKGFPNLTDDDWLYGGETETVQASILQGRQGMMPAFGTMLSDTDVKNVASYVISLSGQAGDAAQIEAGKAVFDAQCAACHGPDAKGMTMVGAPNLTDSTWLYGGLRSDIETTIRQGRNGKMPAHAAVLSEQEAKVLAAYVLSL